MKIIILKLVLLIILLNNKIVWSKDSARFSIGAGIFNYMEDGTHPHNDQSGMLNLEIHSGKKLFNLIKPFAGFLGSNENTYYAYGGFGIDGYYGKNTEKGLKKYNSSFLDAADLKKSVNVDVLLTKLSNIVTRPED